MTVIGYIIRLLIFGKKKVNEQNEEDDFKYYYYVDRLLGFAFSFIVISLIYFLKYKLKIF